MNADRKSTAREHYKCGCRCSQAVMCAYKDVAELTDSQAKEISAPYAGGAHGLCGAVASAEMLLNYVYGNKKLSLDVSPEARVKIDEYEALYKMKNGFVDCKKLRSVENVNRRPCAAYVEDAAEILENMLANE